MVTIDATHYMDFEEINNYLLNNISFQGVRVIQESLGHLLFNEILNNYEQHETWDNDDILTTTIIKDCWCDSTLYFLHDLIGRVLMHVAIINPIKKVRNDCPRYYEIGKLRYQIGSRSDEESLKKSGKPYLTTSFNVRLPIRVIY